MTKRTFVMGRGGCRENEWEGTHRQKQTFYPQDQNGKHQKRETRGVRQLRNNWKERTRVESVFDTSHRDCYQAHSFWMNVWCEKNDREMKGDATNSELTMTLGSGETGESNPLKISQTNETNDQKHCPSRSLSISRGIYEIVSLRNHRRTGGEGSWGEMRQGSPSLLPPDQLTRVDKRLCLSVHSSLSSQLELTQLLTLIVDSHRKVA